MTHRRAWYFLTAEKHLSNLSTSISLLDQEKRVNYSRCVVTLTTLLYQLLQIAGRCFRFAFLWNFVIDSYPRILGDYLSSLPNLTVTCQRLVF